ncbi:MAG: 6-phosphogluconolactonase [Candidatus Omnitrophota bacterium]
MFNLRVFSDYRSLVRGAAEAFFVAAAAAIKKKGLFTVVLSGGKAPQGLYGELSQQAMRFPLQGALLQKTHFFWGDDRDVLPQGPQSNYGCARRLFFSRLSLSQKNIHPIRLDCRGAEQAAVCYEREIRRFFGVKQGEFPRFDLVFLGLGQDGHSASLFPGSGLLQECKRLVAAAYIDAVSTFRVSLTIPVFNNAAQVVFLVSGREKAGILRNILKGHCPAHRYPARLIRPQQGRVFWFVDRASAVISD